MRHLLRNLIRKVQRKTLPEAGYTLIEMLVTIIILGMIILVVNMVLISIVRTSYNTDTRIHIRQGLEFALEVMKRSTKSAERIKPIPNPACNTALPSDPDCLWPDALLVQLSDISNCVVFYVEEDSGQGTLKAGWAEDSSLCETNDTGTFSFVDYLTVPEEVGIDAQDASGQSGYRLSYEYDSASGTAEVSIILSASSTRENATGEPLIEHVTKQVVLITRPNIID
jgi:prepilin-type N-terminal cleavage/methylation domain-containing protein